MNKYLIMGMLMIPSIASGAFLKDGSELMQVDDFSGGLNTRNPSSKLAKNQSPNLKNVLIDELPGSFKVRNGMAVAGRNPYLDKINFQFEFVPDTGDRGLFQSNGGTLTYTTDLMNYAVLTTTLTATAKLRAAQGKGYALFVNKTDSTFISSGVTKIPLDGTNGRPNAPKGAYTAFYQERFFVYSDTKNLSNLHWTEQSSTAGYVIPIDDRFAWPWSNELIIGDGDGSDGSGIDIFRSQMRLHKKNTSIYTLYGIDETDYNAQRTNAFSGTVEHETIVQDDNLEYYLEKDGNKASVMAFDGQDSARLSDDILPDIEALIVNSQSSKSILWDTQSDFIRGEFSKSTASPEGTLSPYTVPFYLNTADQINGGNGSTVTLTNSSTFTAYMSMVSTNTLAGSTDWFSSNPGFYFALNIFSQVTNNGNSFPDVKIRIRNNADDSEFVTQYSPTVNGSKTNTGINVVNGTAPFFTSAQINSGNYYLKFEYVCSGTCEDYVLWVPTVAGNAQITVRPSSNTAFVSEIATATGLSSWGFFNSVNNTNGGSLPFYIKGATSPVNIATETWVSIIPGNRITLPVAKNVFQWTSSMTSNWTTGIGAGFTPNIMDVNVTYNTGGALDTNPQAISWKNHYLLMGSTQSDGSNTVMYVKSKTSGPNPKAWTYFSFLNDYFKSIVKFNNNIYLGSGSTGTVYRWDYGTNDDGYIIDWNYDIADVDMDTIFKEKKQSEYLFDLERTAGANLSFGVSVNGSSFAARSFSIDGTGRMLKVLKHNTSSIAYPSTGFFFKYRLSGAELDKPVTFNKFGVVYTNTDIRPAP